MASFDSGVAVPPTSAYGPKEIDFSWLANLPNTFYQGKQNAFNDQQNQLKTQIQQTFKDGLPIDKATGQPDYRAITQMLAQKGDIGSIGQLGPLVQAQTSGQVNPLTAQLLGMPPQGGGAQPPPQPPQGAPAPPARTPATQQGGDQPGSIVGLVTAKIPQEEAGPTIARIAQLVGVDPNAPLTPGQQIRVNGLVQRYAQTGAAPAGAPAAAAPAPAASAPAAGSPPSRVADAFAALPPSAGNVSPAPQPRPQGPPPQGQPQGQPQPQPPPPQARPPVAAAAPAPQAQPPQQPLVPQVPIPINPSTGKPFANEQQAIAAIDQALVTEKNPRAAKALEDMRDRLEKQSTPMKVGPYETLVDPRTGQPVARGAMAQIATNPEASATLDADAERYRQTGTLPPNMGRGVQGQQQATAIRTRAVQMEVENGGEPADWPERWQQFSTQAAGRRLLAQRAASLTLAENEATTLIPRVRDISAKVSRTQYPTINSLILAAEKGTGGTDVIKLGVAVSSLIPVYARVLKPTGQITEGDTSRAHDILDKAWSDGQINAALDQMGIEIQSAKTALTKSQKEYATKKGDETDTQQPGGTNSTQSGGWTTLPNGVKIREVQ